MSLEHCRTCGHASEILATEHGTFIDCDQSSPNEPALSRLRKRARPSAAGTTFLSEIMTGDVICVREDVPLHIVAAILDSEGVTGLPVVNECGRPIGVISKTDLLRHRDLLSSTDIIPLAGRELPLGFHLEAALEGVVADAMMPVAFTLPENATVSRAAALMAYENIHRVPVVASDGSVVGILSSLDVARWLAEDDGYMFSMMPEPIRDK